MQDRPTPPTSTPIGSPSGGLSLVAAAVVVATVIGSTIWLQLRLSDQSSQIEDLQRNLSEVRHSIDLLRLESEVDGSGVEALVRQIEAWAPDLARASTPAPALERYQERLNEVVEAARHLGPPAYDALLEELERNVDDRDLEEQRWLLRCLLAADPSRGQDYLAQVTRGTRLPSRQTLRFFAADRLLEHDREFAGAVLSQVLQLESHSGVHRQLPPELATEYERVIGTNQFPDFFNLIDRFVASGHEDVVPVLTMLIGRPEHDRMTYQKCIEHLGHLGARQAVDKIKQLYVDIPRREFNPLFQNICLQAIAEIQGSEACEWFQETLKTTDNELVATRLRELIKQNCG